MKTTPPYLSGPASWAAALVAASLVGAGPATADMVRLKNGQVSKAKSPRSTGR